MNRIPSIIPADPDRLAAATAVRPVDARTLFHPVEHALLRQFFRLRPLRSGPADLAEPSSGAWIGIDPGLAFHARSAREVEAKPVYLFTLRGTKCGADSGPGVCWPMAYHATWIPGYARWVVTASADGDDLWGCADIAIGSFRGTDIRAGAGRVIRRAWRRDYREYDQAPWAGLFDTGFVDEAEAHAWRARVWRGCEDV